MAASFPPLPHDAKVTFTPAAHAGLTSTTTPATIKIQGKTFKIDYIRLEKDGQKYDVTNLSQAELKVIAEQCRDIFEKIITDGEVPKQFAVKLERQNQAGSLISGVLGKFFDRFKTPLAPLELKTLEYQTSGGKTKTVEIKEEQKTEVQAEIQAIDQLTLKVFASHELYTKPVEKKSPEKTKQHKFIQETIQEAGATGNKCAALSIAKKELTLSTPENIVRKYNLPPALIAELASKKGEAQIKQLSDALIQKAADTIGSQEDANPFLDDKCKMQNKPCFAAVHTALVAHQQAHPDFVIPTDRKIAVASYAALMRQPGNMLDMPFFLALGVPFLIMREFDDGYDFTEMSDSLVIPGKVKDFDLSQTNILFYNGTNHYQAVILRDKAHSDAVKAKLKQALDETMREFIKVIGKDSLTRQAFEVYSSGFIKLVKLYPEARQEIIQKLKDRYEFATEIDSLDTVAPEEFSRAVRLRMPKSVP
ncbi:MAG: hypothetical protein JSS10_01165 [Verrucomicrobia bacterium]|nr:hypothetical protein [Verrucomicrobiota bacterium]